MDKKIIVFSGMPASGKDTVTKKLCESDHAFVAFKKHRSVGDADKIKDTYFNITVEQFEQKIKNGEFIQYHGRYGRYYGIAEETLLDYLQKGQCPIIHIGRIENYYKFLNNLPSFNNKYGLRTAVYHIQLWETMETLRGRIVLRDRSEEEINKRLEAMEQEFEDNIKMMDRAEKPFTYVVRNTDLTKTCDKITAFIQNSKTDDGYDEFWNYLRSL